MHWLPLIPMVRSLLLLMSQFINGAVTNMVLSDKRIAELSILGEVRDDVTIEELISYNGLLPLWKRIVVMVRYIKVSLVIFGHYFQCSPLGNVWSLITACIL